MNERIKHLAGLRYVSHTTENQRADEGKFTPYRNIPANKCGGDEEIKLLPLYNLSELMA